MMDEIVIQEIDPRDDSVLAEIGRLRVRAWATEVPEIVQVKNWIESADQEARHWVAQRDGVLIASARMSIHENITTLPDVNELRGYLTDYAPLPIASLNRLVVAPESRGIGLSLKLDEVRLNAAVISGCKLAVGVTSSGDRRVSQLVKLGFTLLGDTPPKLVEAVGIFSRPGKALCCDLAGRAADLARHGK